MLIVHFPDQVSSQLLIDLENLRRVLATPIIGVLQLLCGSPIVKEGLHVDQQPWTHFDDISTFDASTLMPCTGGAFSDTARMAKYVQITGDTEGRDSYGDLADSQIEQDWIGIVVRSFMQ